ncbi:MAG: 16S rRNA (guanine(966)-N(2))-methyltransferase RsmD [Anaerolineae bacterium]|nr:16S rRNA (guanine(966)-N(2))-methyltransferase RsmD [Anaerolineae bacterium]
MRVIAGVAKGRRLKLVPGDGTRPIMDRVKEALFNIIRDRIPDSSFLDLFAGTGSVGIEALSRGAASARFVENARLAAKTIEENLAITGLASLAEIVRQDVFDYLKQADPPAFEIVYIAPPQYKTLWLDALTLLDEHPEHIAPDGIVVVQIDPTEKQEITLQHLAPYDERRYGNTLLWFFELLDTPDA